MFVRFERPAEDTGNSRIPLVLACLLLVAVLGYLDFLTGVEFGFSIFYLAPIAIASWNAGWLAGTLVSVAASGAMLVADQAAGLSYSHPFFAFWNAAVKLAVFLTLAFLLAARRESEREREALIQNLREALARGQALQGLLRTCARCRKVRDDHGNWNHVESLLRAQANSEDPGVLCPECAVVALEEMRGEGRGAGKSDA